MTDLNEVNKAYRKKKKRTSGSVKGVDYNAVAQHERAVQEQTYHVADYVAHTNAKAGTPESAGLDFDEKTGVWQQAPLYVAPARAQALWEKLQIKQFQKSFGDISPDGLYQTPTGYTFLQGEASTSGKYRALTNVTNQIFEYYTNIYGSEWLGAAIVAGNFADAKDRAATLKALTNIIAGGAAEPEAGMPDVTGGRGAGYLQGAGYEKSVNPPLSSSEFMGVVADPSKFAQLSSTQQSTFIVHAKEVVNKFAERGQQASNLRRAIGAVATGNYDEIINPTDIGELQDYVKEYDRQRAHTSTSDVVLRGPTFESDSGALEGKVEEAKFTNEGPVFVFNEEWAQGHPAQAAGMMSFMREHYPQASFEIGDKGIAASLPDLIARPVDILAGPGMGALSEIDVGIRAALDNGDPAELKAEKDKLQARLKTAPISEVDQILDQIDHIDNRLGVVDDYHFGDAFNTSVKEAWAPKHYGSAWADDLAIASGVLPGDAAYGGITAATNIVGSVIFDPMFWLGGAGAGIKAAEAGVEGRAALGAWWRHPIAVSAYNLADHTFEDIMATRAGLKAAEGLTESYKIIGEDSFIQKLAANKVGDPSYRVALANAAATGDAEKVRETLLGVFNANPKGLDNVALETERASLAARIDEYDKIKAAEVPTNGPSPRQFLPSNRSEEDLALLRGEEGAHPEYAYHTGNVSDFESYKATGIEARPPTRIAEWEITGGTEPRAYFGSTSEDALRGAPDADNANVLFRTKRSDVPDLQSGLVGEEYSGANLGPESVEYLGSDGGWHVLGPEVDPRTADFEATRIDDVGRLLEIDDLLKGGPPQMGAPPTAAVLKAFKTAPRKWARDVGTLMDANAETKSIFNSWKRMWAENGGEGAGTLGKKGQSENVWYLPGSQFPESSGLGPAAIERSRESIENYFRFIGAKETTINKFMGDWDRMVVANENNLQKAFKELFLPHWNQAFEDSKYLSEAGKMEFRDLFHTSYDSFGSDKVMISAPNEVYQSEPLSYIVVDDPATGLRIPVNQPAFTADALSTGIPVPNVQKLMQDMHPVLTKALRGKRMSQGTSIWKNVVLTGRLGGALPLRINLELQMRMAGLGYASMLNDPWTYLKAVAGKGDFARYAEDPKYAWGAMSASLDDVARIRVETAALGYQVPKSPYYSEALAARIGHFHASPEVQEILLADSTEAFVAKMQRALDGAETPTLQAVAERWDHLEGGLAVNARKNFKYIHSAVGEGDFADEMYKAMLSGSLSDGTKVNTVAFAKRIKEEMGKGWKTGIPEVNGKYATQLEDFMLATEKRNLLQKVYEWGYSKPEIFLSRRPAFRQAALRLENRLLGLGFAPETARDIAVSESAQRISEQLFKIGAHSQGEYFLSNLSPFFPAWRELADTWVMAIPRQLGGGSWAAGTLALARRAQVGFRSLEESGILKKGPRGDWELGLFGAHASLDSLFGILPMPNVNSDFWDDPLRMENLTGLLPSLGGGLGTPLQLAALRFTDNKAITDLIAPFGEGNDWAGMWSKAWTSGALALGAPPEWAAPPWEMLATPGWKSSQIVASVEDSMIQMVEGGWLNDHPAPMPGDFKTDKEYDKAFTRWQDMLLGEAQKHAAGNYGVRTLAAAMSPVSLDRSSDEQRLLTSMYEYLGNLPGNKDLTGESEAQFDVMMNLFKSVYPDADWTTISKYVKAKGVEELPEEVRSDYYKLYSEGLLHVRTPRDMVTWNYGMNAYIDYKAKRSAIYAQFGNNPVQYLLDGEGARDDLAELDREWAGFINFQDAWAHKLSNETGTHVTSFGDLFADSQADSWAELHKVELEGLRVGLTKIQDSVESGTYDDINRGISEALGKLSDKIYETDPAARNMFAILSKWYDNVADPYYQHLEKLYNAVNTLPAGDPRRADIYNEIRHFSADQKGVTLRGFKFPTPEEVAFFTKSPEEQKAWAIKEAAKKPEWLTPFQQSMTGLGKGPKVAKLTDFVAKVEAALKADPNASSTDYDRAAAMEAAKAKELGLADKWRLWKAPMYSRLAETGVMSGHGWQIASQWATSANASLERAGLWSTAEYPEAQPTQRWLFNKLNSLYKSDDEFADQVDSVGRSLADEGMPPVSREDIFWRVFLSGYDMTAPSYLIARS